MGFGDNIARLPAIKYVTDRHPHLRPIVWVPDYFYDVSRNTLTHPNITVEKFSNAETKFIKEYGTRTTDSPLITNLKMNMTDHAFMLFANEIPEVKYKNYLQLNLNPVSLAKWNLPKNFVCIAPYYTAPIRKFVPEYVNEISDYCKSKGYEVIFLGKKETPDGQNQIIKGYVDQELDFSKGLNLTDKTTLLEAAKIMSKAQCVITLDSGLGHLACMTDATVVCGYSSVNPIHRIPYRNNSMEYKYYCVVPPDSEPEKYFQSRIDFNFTHDFRFSYYKNDSLVRSLKPELWIDQLEKVL